MADCVVVLVGAAPARAVVRLWSEIERRWGVSRAHPDAPPHLSLAVVLDRPPAAVLSGVVDAVAARHHPLRVSAASYGVFAGVEPVVHLAVTKTPALAALHEDLVVSLEKAGLSVDPETQPDYWRPHVNLADLSLNAELAGEITAFLLDEGPRHWILEVADLSVLDGSGGPRFPLGGLRASK